MRVCSVCSDLDGPNTLQEILLYESVNAMWKSQLFPEMLKVLAQQVHRSEGSEKETGVSTIGHPLPLYERWVNKFYLQ